MKISEVVIDNRNGIGATPYNQEVNYRGLRVQMKPSVFLDLAAFLRSDDRNTHVTKAIANGAAIGAPFLIIQIPAAWFDSQDYSEPAQVVGHEGRNRMQSVQDAEGNAAIETHLFFRDEIRNRDLTPEIIEELNKGMYMERTRVVKRGPLFTYSKAVTEVIKLRRVNPKPALDFIDKLRASTYHRTIDDRGIVIHREPGEIAVAELSPSIKEEGVVHITSLVVEPRKKGVGAKALDYLKEMAAEAGIGLELFVWENGPVPESSLIRFYTQHGFKYKNGMMIWKHAKPVNETLKRVKGKWALVSKSNPKKVLQYYHGSGHPSKEWVSKVERRVHSFSEVARFPRVRGWGGFSQLDYENFFHRDPIKLFEFTSEQGEKIRVFASAPKKNTIVAVGPDNKVQISIEGRYVDRGPKKKATYFISLLESSSKRKLYASELYANLVLKLDIVLMSDSILSDASAKVWERLSKDPRIHTFIYDVATFRAWNIPTSRRAEFISNSTDFHYVAQRATAKNKIKEGVGRITPQNVTADVGLNQTSVEAEKFGNKVDRDGYPALLMRKKKS